jgi:type IV fimbrial biogenesis protein FimT
MPRLGGFTLWELVWALGIAGVLLGLGVPSFRSFLQDGRRTADVNALVLAIQIARSEAAKRGHNVILCATRDRLRCDDFAAGAPSGWMVFVDADSVEPPRRSSHEALLYVHEPEIEGTIIGNRPYFEFRPPLHRSTNGTVVFCDDRGASSARAVIVSYTGRPRVDTLSPDGKILPCAGLS